MTKTILESLLVDDCEERVRSVAGLAWCAAYGTAQIGDTLIEADRALERGDAAKARQLIQDAVAKARSWHSAYQERFGSLAGYVERVPARAAIQ